MMKVMKQFSIYLPNKPGELKKLLHKVKGLNLNAAATFASRDGAIMRLVPEDPGSFQSILKKDGVAFDRQDVLMVSVADRAGGLLKILAKLQQAHVNIEGLYILGGQTGDAMCVIQADDVKGAQKALA